MPRAIDGTVSVPNSFTPHTIAASSQVNENHNDAASVAETFWGNMIIGGDFTTNPWQRGTTFTSFASGYVADRWRIDFTTAAVFDVLKTADAPTIAQAGVYTAHCLHIDVTTADAALAAGDVFILSQSIEGLNASFLGLGQTGARSITLSFWVKSGKTGVHCVAIRNGALNRSYVAEYTVSAADTWERKTVTIPGDTSGTWLATTGTGLSVVWTLAAGTDFQTTAGAWAAGNFVATANEVNVLDNAANNFKLALVQVEAGSQARPFQVERPAIVMEKCQRYYQKSFLLATAPVQNAGAGTGEYRWPATVAGAAAGISPTVPFTCRMRAAPTVTLFNPAAANAQVRNITDGADLSASSAGNISETGFVITATGTAGTAVGETLGVHWTAAAEL